jgi:hypothetical protein
VTLVAARAQERHRLVDRGVRGCQLSIHAA